MIGQSKRDSALESILNILIGYGIALLAQWAIFPLFGMRPSLRDNLQIGALFTVVSLVRSYCLRRIFNLWHVCKERRRQEQIVARFTSEGHNHD